MKISSKSILLILGIILIGNAIAYFKYGNARPFYEYELSLKSKALLYDQLQQICRKITNPDFPDRDRFLNLTDAEKENLLDMRFNSYKEEDNYIFSLKINTRDTSTLLQTADKILTIFNQDSYIKERYFSQEEIARKLNRNYSRIMDQLGASRDSSSLNNSIALFDLEAKMFLINYFHSSSQKELGLPKISSDNITFHQPDFSRVLILTNIICIILSAFVLISLKRNE